MAANRCPNPNCEYFNRTLPNNAKVCPMCGTPLGNVVASAPAPDNQAPPVPEQPIAQAPATPPAYQPPAPSPAAPEPAPYVPPPAPVAPAYQPPAPSPTAPEPVYIPPVPAAPAYAPPPRPARPAIRLIHSSGREFTLLKEDGYIGRRGETSGTVPEIDLMGIPNEGIVSRTHARIYWDWSQNTYMLVDNNSRNGTCLNGNPLSPGVQYRLNHGDSLQLGQNNLVSFTVSLS
jgi:hypothetical protein